MSDYSEWADWCAGGDALVICGTRMKEHSRTSEGVKWCFSCRRRVEFQRVVNVPDGLSWYGPRIGIECTNCGQCDSDLFPGGYREWSES